jgi:hypothetical protein
MSRREIVAVELLGIGACQFAQEYGGPYREGLHHFFYAMGNLSRDDGRPRFGLLIPFGQRLSLALLSSTCVHSI